MSSTDSSRDEHVLVVDDDVAMRKALSMVLTRAGLSVTSAQDGGEAIAMMETERFEVLVLDLVMPRVSGWDVVKWMRDHEARKPRVVIVLTATSRDVLNELDPDAVNAILFKPFDIQELAGYVAACCRGLRLVAKPAQD